MDEAESAPLHRWLSLCRLLMVHHPRVGARNYAFHLFGDPDLKQGWNAVHAAPGAEIAVSYIWIEPGKGRHSTRRPDVPEAEIHHVFEDELPPFEGSVARRQMHHLAEGLAERGLPNYCAGRLQRVMDSIDAAAAHPLRGPTSAVDARIDREMARLKRVIQTGGSARDLTAPLRDVVRECLDFDLTVTHAANVLAVLLSQCIRLPAPLGNMSPLDRAAACVDHLIGRVLALKDDRQGLKLTPYWEATYLSLLYGNAALLLARQLGKQLPEGTKQRHLLDRRGLYVDEIMAHDLAPCLLHPIDLAPFGMAEFMHAASAGIVDAGGLYAGAQGHSKGPVAVGAAWSAIKDYAAGAEAADIAASIDGENDPQPPDERERLTMFLLAMKLGRGR